MLSFISKLPSKIPLVVSIHGELKRVTAEFIVMCNFAVGLSRQFNRSVIPSKPKFTEMPLWSYLAPEYFMYGKVTDKIDVYAFGVVLLKLLSRRKPINSGYPKGQESLVMWALCKDSRIVPRAATTEIELARKLKEFSFSETGLDQYPIGKFAESFQMIPKTLAENAGLNAMEIKSTLYADHANGNIKVGIDLEERAWLMKANSSEVRRGKESLS
ncbi:unnamed protein product [Lactuca saligna]|uniref:Protein kinase domain-containing protein n=1 Tax=Lactuca saligna TaxID=75948 RepID=A0AA36ENP7_LACSI|nr:unnamed protein product [Lactuca saligna]